MLAFGGDGEQAVLADGGDVHPLLAGVHAAFAEHRPLVLSPDAIWLTIAQGVAEHRRLQADALAPRMVRHRGRHTLSVLRPGPFPSDPAALGAILRRFRDAVADEIAEGRARLLTCDFSTSGDVERVAGDVVLLDTVLEQSLVGNGTQDREGGSSLAA